jgi:hypothetical protein
MNKLRTKWIFFTLIVLIPLIFTFCSTHSKIAACKGSNAHRGYIQKKNKSRYSQKLGFKSKSVKKDYVIKNGIAR